MDLAQQTSLSMGCLNKNTGVDCHFFLQEIFPTQGSNPCLLWFLHWQAHSLPLSHLASVKITIPTSAEAMHGFWQIWVNLDMSLMAKVGMGMWHGKCMMVFIGHDVSGSVLFVFTLSKILIQSSFNLLANCFAMYSVFPVAEKYNTIALILLYFIPTTTISILFI